jgi:gliding motility-associated-like protein
MKILLCLGLTFYFSTIFCQVKIISNNSNGTISLLSIKDCSEESHLINNTFSDIAVTPNNNLYGLNIGLYIIDYLNNSSSFVGTITDVNNKSINGGKGLVALDDNYLLMDSFDSLYKVSTINAKAIPLGKIGYACAGDFAILDDTLYMADLGSHLIKIILNPSKTSILSVIDLGIVNINYLPIYSLFTAYPSCKATQKELFSIVKNNIYKINPQPLTISLVCSIENSSIDSYGATASIEFDTYFDTDERMPNVFTPNGDQVNDVFNFTKCDNILKTTIYNRWGNEVFNTEKQNHFWDGRTTSGEECANGTYFYVIITNEITYKGHIELFR